MLEGIKRFHPHFTEITAVSLALGLMLSLSILSQSQSRIETSGFPSTSRVLNSRSQRTIRVEGFGEKAQEGVSDDLQGAQSIDQSTDIDQALQNPQGSDTVQPNSGESSF